MFAVGEEHHQAVDADADTAGRREAVLEGPDVVLVNGMRFIVAGRTHEGDFQTLEHADLPAEFASMFQGIPEGLFRADVSSTELRND